MSYVILETGDCHEKIQPIAEEIKDVVNLLLANNLTGHLRGKFDQAKRTLQKIEHILYELSLKE